MRLLRCCTAITTFSDVMICWLRFIWRHVVFWFSKSYHHFYSANLHHGTSRNLFYLPSLFRPQLFGLHPSGSKDHLKSIEMDGITVTAKIVYVAMEYVHENSVRCVTCYTRDYANLSPLLLSRIPIVMLMEIQTMAGCEWPADLSSKYYSISLQPWPGADTPGFTRRHYG